MNAKYLAYGGCLFVLFLFGVLAKAQDSDEGKVEAGVTPDVSSSSGVVLAETEMDLPGHYDKDFGMLPGSKLAETLRPISKIDMDGDMNYDGAIDNNDSTDGGPRENVAPGLQLGVGELTKLVIRYKTYENDFPGELYVQLSVSGVNRLSMSGKYSSEKEELESVGTIKVWADKEKKTLLLDSSDPAKRIKEWKADKDALKRGLPGSIPRIVYVEGAAASKKFEGDVRLMISSSHALADGEIRQPSSIYRTAFDHILFTILDKPVEKGFVNDNAEGVWPNSARVTSQASAAQQ